MQSSQDQMTTEKQAKAVSVVIACFAGSLVMTMSVVTFVIKCLAHN